MKPEYQKFALAVLAVVVGLYTYQKFVAPSATTTTTAG